MPLKVKNMRSILICCLYFALALPLTACVYEEDDNEFFAPYDQFGLGQGAHSVGVHVVADGDNVDDLATRYQISKEALIILNHLKPPYFLEEGQRLILPPPTQYRAREGDTIEDVARLFDLPAVALAQMNGFEMPLTLTAGQIIEIPSYPFFAHETAKITPKRPLKKDVQKDVQVATITPPPAKNIITPPLPSVTVKPIPAPKKLPSEPKNHSVAHKTPTAETIEKPSSVALVTTPATHIKMPPLRSPFIWPVNGKTLLKYGNQPSGLFNEGINIAAAAGTPVHAAADGRVVYAGNGIKGYGNLILIKHKGGWVTTYAHLQDIRVTEKTNVTAKQLIGTIGDSGDVKEPQLHFEIRKGTKAINPVGGKS